MWREGCVDRAAPGSLGVARESRWTGTGCNQGMLGLCSLAHTLTVAGALPGGSAHLVPRPQGSRTDCQVSAVSEPSNGASSVLRVFF